MSIIYALIAKNDDTVLVEYSSATGNFKQVTHQILPKLEPNTRKQLKYETNGQQYVFNYIKTDEVIYLCMCDSSKNQSQMFVFLEQLQNELESKYSQLQIKNMISYSINQSMSGVLKQWMEKVNRQVQGGDSMQTLNRQLNAAKEIMVENIDKILEREQKVDILVKKTTAMNFQAQTIKNQTVRRKMYWQSVRMKLLLFGIVLAIIYIFISMMCGGLTLPTC